MKVTPPGRFTLRNELKYRVEPPKKVKTADDLHPLLRMIARDQRDDFKKVLREAGLDPLELRRVLTIHQLRRRGYVDMNGKNLLSFSMDTGEAQVW